MNFIRLIGVLIFITVPLTRAEGFVPSYGDKDMDVAMESGGRGDLRRKRGLGDDGAEMKLSDLRAMIDAEITKAFHNTEKDTAMKAEGDPW